MIPNASKTGRSPTPSSAVGSATRPSAAAPSPRTPETSIAAAEHGEAHHRAIAECAYFIAEKRHFAGGDPLQDWLTAEQKVCGLNR